MTQAPNPTIAVSEESYKNRLRWHLQRADEWVKIADSKATILLSINGAIMVAMVALKKEDLKAFMASTWYFAVFSLLFAAAILLSVYFSARAVLPDLRDDPVQEKSIFNPVFVGEMELFPFRDAYMNLTEADELKHTENQVHAISQIATKKFKRIKMSVFCLVSAILMGAALIAANILTAQ